MSLEDYRSLPVGLPVPVDDDGATHVLGLSVPDIKLWGSDCAEHELRKLTANKVVLFFYPTIGVSDAPEFNLTKWNEIPGARGCTPQACEYSDRYGKFRQLGYEIFGISLQCSKEQQLATKLLALPFLLLSDSSRQLATSWSLPCFEFQGEKFLKRLTVVIEGSNVIGVHYPVFPPNKDAEWAESWILRHNQGS